MIASNSAQSTGAGQRQSDEGEGHPRRPFACVALPRIERQVGEVGDGEEPGLGAQQAGGHEQGQHRPTGPRAPRLDCQGAEAEGYVGEVDVGAEAVGEVGRPGQHDRRRDDADPAVEPERAEPVDEVADQPQRGVGDDHRHRDRAAAERGRHQAEQIGERVRRRRQGGAVVRADAVRQFAPPDQGVDGVVVGEADREDEQQHRRHRGDPGDGGQPASEPGWHWRTV